MHARVFAYTKPLGGNLNGQKVRLFGLDYSDPQSGRRYRIRAGCPTKEEATDLLRAKLTEGTKAQIVNAPSMEAIKPVTFAEFVEDAYLSWSRAKNRPSTVGRKNGIYENLLKPAFGSIYLRSITAADIEQYMTRRRSTVQHRKTCKGGDCSCPKIAPATVNKERGILQNVLNRALRRGLVDRNVVELVESLNADNKRDRWLAHAEVEQLVMFCPPWLQPIVTVACNTGMREGELCGMRWGDIDWKNRTIRVDSRTSKTHKTRYVPINSETERALAMLRLAVGKEGMSGPVFVSPEAGEGLATKSYHPKSVSHGFHRAARAAGFSVEKTDPNRVTFHTTRHTFASWCVQAGIPTGRSWRGSGTPAGPCWTATRIWRPRRRRRRSTPSRTRR